MMIDHIIFDLDGVLIDSSPCHSAAYQNLWDYLQISGPDYSKIAGKRTIEVISSLTKHLFPTQNDINEWVDFKQRYARAEMQNNLVFYEDVRDSIKQLYHQGIKLSLGTGASKKSAFQALNIMGIQGFFEYIVTADDVSHGKPDPLVFNRIIDNIHIDRASTLVIEDSVSGVHAAISANVNVCTIHSEVSFDHDLFQGTFKTINGALKQLGIIS